MVTYSNANGASADRCELEVKFGDGQSAWVQRVNGAPCSSDFPNCDHCGENINGSTKINYYYIQHTYSNPGDYIISMEDPNRNSGILNVPNSVSVRMYLETKITVGVENHSVQLLDSPIQPVNNGLTFNLNAYDPDGDVLSYSLVKPKRGGGQEINGYSFVPGASIDQVSGEITIAGPLTQGNYCLAVKIEECRGQGIISSTIVDFNIDYSSGYLNNGEFVTGAEWTKDYFGRYSLTIMNFDTLNLDFTFVDSTIFPANNIQVFPFSEALLSSNNAVYSETVNFNNITGNIYWTPELNHVRCAPYVFSLKGVSGAFSAPQDLTLLVFVRDQSTFNCNTGCGEILSVEDTMIGEELKIAPNPVRKGESITISSSELNGVKCEVINIQGQSQGYYRFENDQVTINTSGWPIGLYFYLIQSDGINKTGKILVQ
ncbi:MAG: T9SS type A sorting domain-containing protein [Salibacteraceae bacterium]